MGPQRISLRVSQHQQQVLVGLRGERFEPALPDVPRALGVVVLVIASHVRVHQPLHPPRQVAVFVGPDRQVEVIGSATADLRHEAVADQPHPLMLLRLGEQGDEGVVVGVLVKHGQTGVATVEHVVTEAADRGPGAAGYAGYSTPPDGVLSMEIVDVRVARGGCPPRAPTDPYVRALAHTVPQIMGLPWVGTPSGLLPEQVRDTFAAAG